jgi:quinol monooxygenase YgiN
MLIVVGTMTIDPDKLEALRPAVVDVMAATQAEAGNIGYSFSQDLADPATIRIVELWESQAAIDEHMKTPHLATFFQALGASGAVKASALNVHEAQEGVKLM